jgi:hypothetical protein
LEGYYSEVPFSEFGPNLFVGIQEVENCGPNWLNDLSSQVTNHQQCILHCSTAQSTGIFRDYGVAEAPPGFQAGWSDCMYFFSLFLFIFFLCDLSHIIFTLNGFDEQPKTGNFPTTPTGANSVNRITGAGKGGCFRGKGRSVVMVLLKLFRFRAGWSNNVFINRFGCSSGIS